MTLGFAQETLGHLEEPALLSGEWDAKLGGRVLRPAAAA
jgi:hypothetical protein